MKTPFKDLKSRLFFWYITSLFSIAAYFFLAIHVLKFQYGIEIFLVLLLILALEGFYIIRKMTNSLETLISTMKMVTGKNLDERITGVEGEDEISQLASSFNDLMDRLNESFKREQQFIGDVAHELKTPLANLRSSLDITLSRDRTQEEYKKAIEEAIVDTNHLASTLKNVLDLAWSETPNESKKREEVNLTQLFKELSDITQKMATFKNIRVRTVVGKNIIIMGFKDKLARALMNILENAVKYTPAGGSVTLLLGLNRKRPVITVNDTGPGIPEKDLPHIFDRFYRGTKSSNVFGSGLGLAIAKSIINLHQGTIAVKSKIGRGTSFVITLPAQH